LISGAIAEVGIAVGVVSGQERARFYSQPAMPRAGFLAARRLVASTQGETAEFCRQ
jgi:hypothetical protein